MTPRLLTDKQMARRLRVTREWLRAETEAGSLPAIRAGDVYLYDPRHTETLLLERARQLPGAAAPPDDEIEAARQAAEAADREDRRAAEDPAADVATRRAARRAATKAAQRYARACCTPAEPGDDEQLELGRRLAAAGLDWRLALEMQGETLDDVRRRCEEALATAESTP